MLFDKDAAASSASTLSGPATNCKLIKIIVIGLNSKNFELLIPDISRLSFRKQVLTLDAKGLDLNLDAA